MEPKEPVFVFASSEVREILADNEIDLVDVLRSQGFDVSTGFASDPASAKNSGYKDPATVILASAALVAALTPVISKIISALAHKAVVVQEMVLTPVMDEQGNLVKDSLNEPVMYWAPRTRIVESSEAQRDTTVLIKGHGVEISINPTPESQNTK
jgi:hypothetical protein